MNQQIASMQAEIEQLKLLVYFQGNAVLNQLLKLIDGEFRAEDRNRHHIQNAMLRKIIKHVETVNNQLDTEATKGFDRFIKQQKADELSSLISHFNLMSSNARENGYMAQADAIDDMCDEVFDRIDELGE